MNTLDRQYQELLQTILKFGTEKSDRTGTGTISVFGRQIRHKMSEGYPLLTTKKMAFKTMVTELLWFLKGDTNIKYLVDNGCNIWNGDAYRRYETEFEKGNAPGETLLVQRVDSKSTERKLSMEKFIAMIQHDDEFAKKWGDLGPIYGKQWRDWNGRKTDSFVEFESNGYNDHIEGIDQIQNLINDLKTNPNSRRLMVNAWNVGELDQMVLPPCHYGFQVYTRELSLEERRDYRRKVKNIGREIAAASEQMLDNDNIPKRAISLMWNQRSVDTFLGLPFNIASYGLLLEIIAKEVNMVPDELVGNLGDVHLYKNHIEQAKEQITRKPMKLPEISYLDEYHYLHDKELVGELSFSKKIKEFRPDMFKLAGYEPHPAIKAPLSN